MTPAQSQPSLILSLFPGIDLLGRGFALENWTVVRGPDPIFGEDIRDFHPPPGAFLGIIGGPPCQDFSAARRTKPTGLGIEMLAEFERCIDESQPEWWLLENVPRCPTITVTGYETQRIDINAREAGCAQHRPRHFQFGSRDNSALSPSRITPSGESQKICLASEARRPRRRDWPDFCELQGLPRDFTLPGFTIEASYRAVGNGVPIPLARLMAKAIRYRTARWMVEVTGCRCGCGRLTRGKQQTATVACRKRLSRKQTPT